VFIEVKVVPVVGVASAPNTASGQWLVAADGGVFTVGDAPFHGCPGSRGHP